MGVCKGPLIKGGRGDGVGVCKAKDHSQRLRLLNQLLCVLRMCTRVGWYRMFELCCTCMQDLSSFSECDDFVVGNVLCHELIYIFYGVWRYILFSLL